MYFEFSDKAKIRWAPQGDGTFEAQLLETERHHLAVRNLPDANGWAIYRLLMLYYLPLSGARFYQLFHIGHL